MPLQDDGTPYYDASNIAELTGATGVATGLRPRSTHPMYASYGSVPWLGRAEEVLPTKVPRSDWAALIPEMWAKLAWPMCAIDFKCRSQDSTNFCFANAPCAAVDVKRRMQGLPHIETSAASVACPVTGYRNVGGWGIDVVNYLQAKGACSSAIWPNASISHSYDAAADKDRPNRRVLEFVDVPAKDLDYLATFLFARFPCPVGYDWWSHEVLAVALKLLGTGRANFPHGGNPAILGVIRNSWQNAEWGYEYNGFIGYGDLDEAHFVPDDCQAVREVVSYPD